MNTENNNISQEEFEQIENYLLNKMTNNEQLIFENNLKIDSELREKVGACKILIDAVEVQSLKEKMDDFHNDVSSNVISLSKTRRKWQSFAMAASIAVLIGLSGFWFLNNNSKNQKLYAKYYKPDPGLPTVMSTSSQYDFYDAMVNYKRGDYKLAIEKWKLLLKQKPQNDTLNYFIGVAYLADKNEIMSIPYLEKTVKQTQSIFRNEGFYYLGLAYLKNDNIQLAKKNLLLSNNDKSNEIISQLNN